MTKYSVNLIIRNDKDLRLIKLLNVILPVTAAVTLILFIIIYLINVFNINRTAFANKLAKQEIAQLEGRISSLKNTESVFTVAQIRLNVLEQIISKKNNFIPLIDEINRLKLEGILLDSISVDKEGGISLVITASSSGSLDNLVSDLIKKDENKVYSNILAQGILRENKGTYHLTINLKGNKSLFK